MSGRQANGWGECVWCGEMLLPEDNIEGGTSDHCRFCNQWYKLAHIAINRRAYAEKKISENIEAKNLKAVIYWTGVKCHYDAIHKILIEALNVKKKLRESGQECFPQDV